MKKYAIIFLLSSFVFIAIRHIDLTYNAGYAYNGNLKTNGSVVVNGTPADEVGMSHLDFALMSEYGSNEFSDLIDIFRTDNSPEHLYLGLEPQQNKWFRHLRIDWMSGQPNRSVYWIDIGF